MLLLIKMILELNENEWSVHSLTLIVPKISVLMTIIVTLLACNHLKPSHIYWYGKDVKVSAVNKLFQYSKFVVFLLWLDISTKPAMTRYYLSLMPSMSGHLDEAYYYSVTILSLAETINFLVLILSICQLILSWNYYFLSN